MKTVSEHNDTIRAQFLALSNSRRNALRRDARKFIDSNPGCADHSTFWRGLSARHILAFAYVAGDCGPNGGKHQLSASAAKEGGAK